MPLRFRQLSGAAALCVLAFGLVVLAGWLLGISTIKSLLPGLATMKANTALSFVLSGLALWCLHRPDAPGRRWVLGYASAAVVIVLCGSTLIAHGLSRDLPLDRMFPVDPPGSPGTLYPGRMGMSTAAAFTIIGVSLLLLSARRGVAWVGLLASLAGGIAMLNVLGYVYHAHDPAAMVAYTQMALHTSLGLVVLSAGAICARPEQGLLAPLTGSGIGGNMARLLFPAAIVVPPVLGGMRWAGQRAGLFDTEYGLAIGTVLSMFTFALLVWLNARLLNRMDQQRREVEGALHDLNRELDARIHRRTAQLEAAVDELEAFSYSVSHDLRAPLRAIDGFSRIVIEEHGSRLGDEGARMLRLVRDNTQNMGSLIDDLLRFSRLGRATMRKVRVDMRHLAEQAAEELSGRNGATNVDLRIGALPESTGDPQLLKQIFVNLVANALKFSRDRDPAVIHVDAYRQDGRTVYFVKDNGAGFDMQYAGKLFGVFQRLHRVDEYEGTGVGLALVKRIVQRHGGRVWAEGRVGQGATFYFTLNEEPSYERDHHDVAAGGDSAGGGQPQRSGVDPARVAEEQPGQPHSRCT